MRTAERTRFPNLFFHVRSIAAGGNSRFYLFSGKKMGEMKGGEEIRSLFLKKSGPLCCNSLLHDLGEKCLFGGVTACHNLVLDKLYTAHGTACKRIFCVFRCPTVKMKRKSIMIICSFLPHFLPLPFLLTFLSQKQKPVPFPAFGSPVCSAAHHIFQLL